MNKTPLKDYNLHETLMGGQSFSWDLINGWYYGVTQSEVIKVRESDGHLEWETYPSVRDEDSIIEYFALGDRSARYYDAALEAICGDGHVRNAYQSIPNIRILRQGFDQTLISFIISAFNSVKSIRTRIRRLNKLIGEKLIVDGIEFSLFPTTQALANAPIEVFQEAGLGYRAKYVKSTSERLILSDISSWIRQSDEENARLELLKISGVGPKVADCVLVFALGHKNVMPLDVWGKRALTRLYNLPENMSYTEMRQWAKDYFNGHASLAAQYLFEWMRRSGN